MAVQDLERIEQRIDRTVAGAVTISDSVGGIMFQNMSEVLEFAKLMSVADVAVPKHLRGNPGACLSIVTQSLEWRMSPFSVANKSYSVNDRLAYESQLIHAVVEARAPLKQRLRKKYTGEGDKRRCTVIGHFKNEVDPVEYESPEIGKITPKNSPLWRSDPDLQLWYYSVRAFARANCPDVLLGIYAEDELEGRGAARAKDVTPSVGSRLKGGKGRGFSEDGVHAALEHKPADILPDAGQSDTIPVPVFQKQGEQAGRQLDLADDAENEVAQKKAAAGNVDNLDDLAELVKSTTAYLKKAKRTDLLADFLAVASKREAKLQGAAA
jgi:hypothetical protein